MAQGTLFFQPIQVVFRAGVVVPGAKAYFYLAGSTTPVNVFSDVGLTTPITQPVVADANGVFVEIFLTPGTAYKVDIQTSAGVSLTGYPADNQLAIPASAATVDQTETAGEALTAGQVAYLSDGSGGKTVGQLYKADIANGYSSTLPLVGMVPSAIAAGASGAFRIAGQIGGLTVAAGTDYYVGTAGALSSTKGGRWIGRADSASSLVIAPNPPPMYEPWVNDFRLTLTTAVPVTNADVTAAVTLYCTPYLGNRIDLPDANGNPVRFLSAEFSIAVPATTSQMYDIFCFTSSGTPTLELLAWTNDTTRATAVVRTTNGRLLKSGDNTRMYLGSFRTTTVSGQTEDSATKRFLNNYYHRLRRPLIRPYADAGPWNYTTAIQRQANANAANQVAVVVGVQEVLLSLRLLQTSVNGTASVAVQTPIGINSTSATPSTGTYNQVASASAAQVVTLNANLDYLPAVGYNFFAMLEFSAASGTTTWTGSAAGCGMTGWVEG